MFKIIGVLLLMFASLTHGFFMDQGFYPGQYQPGQGYFPGQYKPGTGYFPGRYPSGSGSFPGYFQPSQGRNPMQWPMTPTNVQLDNCIVTKTCQALASNSNIAPVLQQIIASLPSQFSHAAQFYSNQKVNISCTNYDSSDKPNSCRTNIPLMTNFNVNAFLGKWYFLALYNFGDLGDFGCATDVFTLNGTSLTLTTTFYSSNGSGDPSDIPLDMNVFKSGEMKFNSNGNKPDIRIVNTDYTNYVIWYNCGTSSTGQPFERLEVAVRSPTSVSASTLTTIMAIINRIGFNTCEVGFVPRSVCPSV